MSNTRDSLKSITTATPPHDAHCTNVSLTFGSVGFEAEVDAKGERLIWVENVVVDRRTALRRPGESYSDVIMRLVEIEAKGV